MSSDSQHISHRFLFVGKQIPEDPKCVHLFPTHFPPISVRGQTNPSGFQVRPQIPQHIICFAIMADLHQIVQKETQRRIIIFPKGIWKIRTEDSLCTCSGPHRGLIPKCFQQISKTLHSHKTKLALAANISGGRRLRTYESCGEAYAMLTLQQYTPGSAHCLPPNISWLVGCSNAPHFALHLRHRFVAQFRMVMLF